MKKLIKSNRFLGVILILTGVITAVISKDLTCLFFIFGIAIAALTDKPIKNKQKARTVIFKSSTIPHWGINEEIILRR